MKIDKLDLVHKCAIIGTCDTKQHKTSLMQTSNVAQASSARPLNKCWQSWEQACVTLAGQPHSAERTSCWWPWCTGVSIEPNFTLAWPMAWASRRSVAPSKRLKMYWSNPSSFTCQAKKHCNRAIQFLKLCWWMRPNSRLNAQKKTKTALPRQKEAAYPKSAVDSRLAYRANPRHRLL